MQAPSIRVWKTPFDYIVAVNQHCYEMNHSADQPNGACIYLGTIAEQLAAFVRPDGPYFELRGTDDIPLAVLQQTVKLVTRDGFSAELDDATV